MIYDVRFLRRCVGGILRVGGEIGFSRRRDYFLGLTERRLE